MSSEQIVSGSVAPKLWYCTGFENNAGICIIVQAPGPSAARKEAADPFYGQPTFVRQATEEDIYWYRVMGGEAIALTKSSE